MKHTDRFPRRLVRWTSFLIGFALLPLILIVAPISVAAGGECTAR